MSQAPGWTHTAKPAQLFRRFEFGGYSQTRRFLDRLAELSEQSGVVPQNINFGVTYVNVTLAAVGEELVEADWAFARTVSGWVDAAADPAAGGSASASSSSAPAA